MAAENIQKLLTLILQNQENKEQWLQDPVKKTKEWSLEIDATTLEIIRDTIKLESRENLTFQELQQARQKSIAKIQEATKHSLWTFYAMLVMHIFAFLAGFLMLLTGLYACLGTPTAIGYLLLIAGAAEIIYFLIAKPINTLHQTIGNMVQIEVALGGWFQEMTLWQPVIFSNKLEEKQSVSQAMRDSTKWTIMMIEDYCGSKEIFSSIPFVNNESQGYKFSDWFQKISASIKKLSKKTTPIPATIPATAVAVPAVTSTSTTPAPATTVAPAVVSASTTPVSTLAATSASTTTPVTSNGATLATPTTPAQTTQPISAVPNSTTPTETSNPSEKR